MAAISEPERAGELPRMLPEDPGRRPVNLRSVLLGLVGVCLICGLTPFNDYVVGNTYMVGNFLPVGLLLFLLVLVLLVNAPLRRYWPRQALSAGELSVVLGMTLVSCALPSSGLMRYLPAFLTGIYSQAGAGGDALNVLTALHLPDWMFPTFQSADIRQRAGEPVVQYYLARIPIGAEADTWTAILRAWMTPAITWGIFFAAMFAAVLCLMAIVRRQWVENERLAFPLATVYLSLIEQPGPGSAFNALFRARTFWIAAGLVFFIHGINALHQYDTRLFPEIPIRYDLNAIFADAPWAYTRWSFKSATLFFSIIGITYFLQTKVAFSLWVAFIIWQVALMIAGTHQAEITDGMTDDQLLGAVVPFTLAILWVGRHHWAMVLRQMVRGPRGAESPGRYLPYFVAGWGLIVAMGVMVAWLMAAGTTFAGALVVVVGLMVMFLVIARVVAETGLIFVQIPVQIYRPWIFATQALPGALAFKTSIQNYFFGTLFQGLAVHDMRETLSPFASHAFRVADSAAYDRTPTWRRALPFTLALVLALGVGYLVAGYSTLRTEYAYGATLERAQSSPINPYGVGGMISYQVLGPTNAYLTGNGPIQNHNHWTHFGIGAGLTSLLSVLRLRFVNWPLHPIGYLLVFSYPMQMIWFSIFVGWLAKLLVVRFGGAELFRKARFLFIGLIIGEAGAASFWLIVSLARVMLGLDYHAIRLLPG